MAQGRLAVAVWPGGGRVNWFVAPEIATANEFLLNLRSKSWTRFYPVRLVNSRPNLMVKLSSRKK